MRFVIFQSKKAYAFGQDDDFAELEDIGKYFFIEKIIQNIWLNITLDDVGKGVKFPSKPSQPWRPAQQVITQKFSRK